MLARPDDAASILVLTGAGLSVAAGVPRFHEADATWNGHRVGDLATPEGWANQPDVVRAFYDDCRAQLSTMLPTPAHETVARLQQRWGPERVTLVTQNIDGLLLKAGAPHVYEMYGSLLRLACETDPTHPAVGVFGKQNPDQRCRLCGGPLRPDVCWFDESPRSLEDVRKKLLATKCYMAVGISSESCRAADLGVLAYERGVETIEINPKPSGKTFTHVIAEPAAEALARIIGEWLDEETD